MLALIAALSLATSACESSTPTPPSDSEPTRVADFHVAASSHDAVTVAWTQVDDGEGDPAHYAIRYGTPALDWDDAADTEETVTGTSMGAEASFTFQALAPATTYEFQVVAFRPLSTGAVFGARSNIVEATTAAAPQALTAGTVEATAGDGSVALVAAPSQGGTPPYTYQWHGSTSDPGASPGAGTLLTGLTTLTATHDGLTNGSTYHYRLVTEDAAGATVVSAAVSATPEGSSVALLLHEDWSGGIDTDVWEDGYRAEHHSVVNDPTGAGRGPVLRAEHTDNGGASFLAHWIYGEDEENPTGEAFVRTWFYVPDDFDGANYAKMMIIKGNRTDNLYSSFGVAGIPANGTNFFEGYVSYGAPSHGEPGVHFYTYHADMPGDYGHYDYTEAAPLAERQPEAGAWHQFDFWLKQNTIGQADGAQRVWIDGELVMEWTGIRFRTDDILQANAVAITFSSSDNQGQVWYVDDVYVYDSAPAGLSGW